MGSTWEFGKRRRNPYWIKRGVVDIGVLVVDIKEWTAVAIEREYEKRNKRVTVVGDSDKRVPDYSSKMANSKRVQWGEESRDARRTMLEIIYCEHLLVELRTIRDESCQRFPANGRDKR